MIRALEPRACQPATRSAVTSYTSDAIVSDCLYRATFHGFLAQGLFFLNFRLLVNVRMPAVVIPLEVRGGRFPAEITIDALIVDVKLPLNVLSIFVSDVGHTF